MQDFQIWNPATWRRGDAFGIALSVAGLFALCAATSFIN